MIMGNGSQGNGDAVLLGFFSSTEGVRWGFQRGSFPTIPKDKFLFIQSTCTMEKVAKALKDMHPHKAPSPDSFNLGFFQKRWRITGSKLIAMVQRVMEGGDLLMGLVEVLVVLIQKKEHPGTIAHFRPISLCNIAYNVITKLITNRLKVVIGGVIVPSQCSFIQRRHTIDNVIVC